MKNMVKIYIATHKKYEFPKDNIYIPLQVGSEGKDNLGYICDNTGDNISEKNNNFCELTGIYWMWKNENDCEYIGLNHYRRYFSNKKHPNNYSDILTEEDIEKYFKAYDIILSKRFILYKIKNQYKKIHYKKDLDSVRDIIKNRHNDYLISFDKFMNSHFMSMCNMFIMKKTDFDNYCEWLFDILFELEKITDISKYNNYQKRLFGFLSERLLNVWVLNNISKEKIKYLKIYETEKTTNKFSLKNLKKNK